MAMVAASFSVVVAAILIKSSSMGVQRGVGQIDPRKGNQESVHFLASHSCFFVPLVLNEIIIP